MKKLAFNQLLNRYTDLTALQIAYLNRLRPLLAKVADIVGAQVVLALRCKDRHNFLLARGFEPHTTFNPIEEGKFPILVNLDRGDKLTEVFKSKKKINMGKSVLLGKEMSLYAFPILMEDELIAVAICGVADEDVSSMGFQRLLQTGEIVLKHGERSLIACDFKPINHSMGLIITDKFSRIIYSNKIAQQICYQLGINNLQGLYVDAEHFNKGVRKQIISQADPYSKEIHRDKLIFIRREWPIYEAGNLVLKIVTLSDITELREKDKEIKVKSAVIQEIHHRMKNNLQTIASLLRMQDRRSDNAEVKKALAIAENRILSIGIVHEMLSQEYEDTTDVGKILTSIANQVGNALIPEDFTLVWNFDFEKLSLSAAEISNLALIFNELLLNAFEHGFKDKSSGRISCTLKNKGENYEICFVDDGRGFDEKVMEKSPKTLGMQIIKTLVEEQLKGKAEFLNTGGAMIRINCPIQKR